MANNDYSEDLLVNNESFVEDNDSDDGEPEIMHPDDPAMQRIQLAFERQLKARKQEVSDELNEQDAKLKQETKRREELGVELYTVQQQLAKLQGELEQTGSEQSDYATKRRKADAALKEVKSEFWIKLTSFKAKRVATN